MACIGLSTLDSEDMNFLAELRDLVAQRGHLSEVAELWSEAMAEGELCDGPLLSALIRVAAEEGRDKSLEMLFE
jgi:hypothetical protein